MPPPPPAPDQEAYYAPPDHEKNVNLGWDRRTDQSARYFRILNSKQWTYYTPPAAHRALLGIGDPPRKGGESGGHRSSRQVTAYAAPTPPAGLAFSDFGFAVASLGPPFMVQPPMGQPLIAQPVLVMAAPPPPHHHHHQQETHRDTPKLLSAPPSWVEGVTPRNARESGDRHRSEARLSSEGYQPRKRSSSNTATAGSDETHTLTRPETSRQPTSSKSLAQIYEERKRDEKKKQDSHNKSSSSKKEPLCVGCLSKPATKKKEGLRLCPKCYDEQSRRSEKKCATCLTEPATREEKGARLCDRCYYAHRRLKR